MLIPIASTLYGFKVQGGGLSPENVPVARKYVFSSSHPQVADTPSESMVRAEHAEGT